MSPCGLLTPVQQIMVPHLPEPMTAFPWESLLERERGESVSLSYPKYKTQYCWWPWLETGWKKRDCFSPWFPRVILGNLQECCIFLLLLHLGFSWWQPKGFINIACVSYLLEVQCSPRNNHKTQWHTIIYIYLALKVQGWLISAVWLMLCAWLQVG